MNTLTEAQKTHYGTLWTAADADRDGAIGPNDAASFFHLSGLDQNVLGNIWGQVCQAGSSLSPDQFVYYCELISMAQSGVAPNLQELLRIKGTGTPIPFPTFSGVASQPAVGASVVPQAAAVDQFSHLVAGATELHGWAENFNALDVTATGFVQGQQALTFFQQSGLPQVVLSAIWDLADVGKDGKLDVYEFCVAMFFITEYTKGHTALPPNLPESLRNSIWNAGQQQQQQQQASATGATAAVSGPFAITAEELATDTSIFQQNNVLGFIEGTSAVNLLSQSGLSQDQLGQIYVLADTDKDGKLNQNEFLIAMKVVRARLLNHPIPTTVPPEILASINKQASASSNAPQTSAQIYEQRINDLQDRCNKADNEIAALKVNLQNVKSDLIKAETLKSEAESRASQAEARAQALSSKGQEDTNAALQKINELSAQLQKSFSQIEDLNAKNSSLELKLQQAVSQFQASQSQLQNAQHQISVSAFSGSAAAQQPATTSPWGTPSTSSSAFGGASQLPPPITSPSTSYPASPSPSPFGNTPTTSSSNIFGASVTPSSPFATSSAPQQASSQPQNPFLMGMNFS